MYRFTPVTILAVLLFGEADDWAIAEMKEVIAEATYLMGDAETPSFAEEMVLQKAKQIALEQAGTYVQSYTRVRNLELTEDEIKTVAGGVLKTEVLQRNRVLSGDGLRLHIKIRAEITTDKLEQLATRIHGGTQADDYKKLQGDIAKLTTTLESLKRQVEEASTVQAREVVLDRIRDIEKEFRGVRSTEEAFYRRLLSGEELSAKVTRAFKIEQDLKEAEQQRRVRQELALSRLLQVLKSNGHAISIEPPTPNVSLDRPDTVWLDFIVTVTPSEEAKTAIRDLDRACDGDPPSFFASQVEEAIDGMTLVLSVLLKDGARYTTKAPRVHGYRSSLRSYDAKLWVKDTPTVVNVAVELPRKLINQVTSFEAEIR